MGSEAEEVGEVGEVAGVGAVRGPGEAVVAGWRRKEEKWVSFWMVRDFSRREGESMVRWGKAIWIIVTLLAGLQFPSCASLVDRGLLFQVRVYSQPAPPFPWGSRRRQRLRG